MVSQSIIVILYYHYSIIVILSYSGLVHSVFYYRSCHLQVADNDDDDDDDDDDEDNDDDYADDDDDNDDDDDEFSCHVMRQIADGRASSVIRQITQIITDYPKHDFSTSYKLSKKPLNLPPKKYNKYKAL